MNQPDIEDNILDQIETQSRWKLVRKYKDLEWLYSPAQKLIDDMRNNVGGMKFVAECARQLGKSFYVCIKGVEDCLTRINARAVVGTDTAKNIDLITAEPLRHIFDMLPPEMKPVKKKNDRTYHFPNGNTIMMIGLEAYHPYWVGYQDHERPSCCF